MKLHWDHGLEFQLCLQLVPMTKKIKAGVPVVAQRIEDSVFSL